MYLNSVQIIGFIGKDPERRQARSNGAAFTVLSVATQRSWKNADDEWASKTKWHRVVAWNSLGERVCLSSIILSPLNGNVKLSPHETGDIHVESEGTATSARTTDGPSLNPERCEQPHQSAVALPRQYAWPRPLPCRRFRPETDNRTGVRPGGIEGEE